MPPTRPRRYVRGTSEFEYRWNPVRGHWQYFAATSDVWKLSALGVLGVGLSFMRGPTRAEIERIGFRVVSYASTWAEPEQDPYPGDER